MTRPTSPTYLAAGQKSRDALLPNLRAPDGSARAEHRGARRGNGLARRGGDRGHRLRPHRPDAAHGDGDARRHRGRPRAGERARVHAQRRGRRVLVQRVGVHRPARPRARSSSTGDATLQHEPLRVERRPGERQLRRAVRAARSGRRPTTQGSRRWWGSARARTCSPSTTAASPASRRAAHSPTSPRTAGDAGPDAGDGADGSTGGRDGGTPGSARTGARRGTRAPERPTERRGTARARAVDAGACSATPGRQRSGSIAPCLRWRFSCFAGGGHERVPRCGSCDRGRRHAARPDPRALTPTKSMRTLIRCGAAALLLALPTRALADEPPAPPPPTSSTPRRPRPARGSSASAAAPPSVAPSAPIAPSTPITLPTIPGDTGHFEFGSYGRVVIASDGRGGTGRDANVVSYGDRIDEDSYGELELRREDRFAPSISTKVVWTLGFFPPFFHFSGDQTQAIAIRNLYAQAHLRRPDALGRLADVPRRRHLPARLVAARQPEHRRRRRRLQVPLAHRRDDHRRARRDAAARLDLPVRADPRPVPNVLAAQAGPGAENVTVLDRPRTIETLKITHLFKHPNSGAEGRLQVRPLRRGAGALRGRLHGHRRSTRRCRPRSRRTPAGSSGTEIAYWTGQRDTFVQLFFRHAEGIAAYDPLAVPLTFANDRTTRRLERDAPRARRQLRVRAASACSSAATCAPSATATPRRPRRRSTTRASSRVRPQLYIGERWGVAARGSLRGAALRGARPATPTSRSSPASGARASCRTSPRAAAARTSARSCGSSTRSPPATRRRASSTRRRTSSASAPSSSSSASGAEWWFNSSSYP